MEDEKQLRLCPLVLLFRHLTNSFGFFIYMSQYWKASLKQYMSFSVSTFLTVFLYQVGMCYE